MDGPEHARMRSSEGDIEKSSAGAEKTPATGIVLFKSKKLLWTTFVLIFCSRLFLLLVDGVVLRQLPQLMSDFPGSARSVLSVLPTIIGISSGVLRLPMARIIDRSTRRQGFDMVWCVTQLGLFILTVAPSLAGTVAGYLLYGIGSTGTDFVLTVILADMTSLKNRGLIYGIYATPLILKTLASPHVAQLLESQIESQIDWREIFGPCSAVNCVCCLILSSLFAFNKAKLCDEGEQGDTTTTTEGKPTIIARSRRFLMDLDIPGVVLAIAGICLLLLAPIHFPGTQEGWSAAFFAVALLLGFFSMTSLFVWEYYLNPASYFPRSLTRDWNVENGCAVVMLTAASIACWSSHVSSYLQVVEDRTIDAAGQVTAIRTVAFACSAPLIGLLVQQTGNYKYPAVSAGACLVVLTSILTFTFQREGAWASFQISMGVAESVLLLCSQMAIISWIDHQNVAMALGIWGTTLSIAVAIGSTGATDIWTNSLPHILWRLLPADSKDLTSDLLSSLENQKQHPMGSPIRDALVAAYGTIQQVMLCIAVCMALLGLAFLFLWKNINLRERRDVQGARARGVVW